MYIHVYVYLYTYIYIYMHIHRVFKRLAVGKINRPL